MISRDLQKYLTGFRIARIRLRKDSRTSEGSIIASETAAGRSGCKIISMPQHPLSYHHRHAGQAKGLWLAFREERNTRVQSVTVHGPNSFLHRKSFQCSLMLEVSF